MQRRTSDHEIVEEMRRHERIAYSGTAKNAERREAQRHLKRLYREHEQLAKANGISSPFITTGIG